MLLVTLAHMLLVTHIQGIHDAASCLLQTANSSIQQQKHMGGLPPPPPPGPLEEGGRPRTVLVRCAWEVYNKDVIHSSAAFGFCTIGSGGSGGEGGEGGWGGVGWGGVGGERSWKAGT